MSGQEKLYDQLIQKIDNQKAVITIVGMGYVGLPLALLFARQGLHVFGLDLDAKKIKSENHPMLHKDSINIIVRIPRRRSFLLCFMEFKYGNA